jgi:hypothetical protein
MGFQKLRQCLRSGLETWGHYFSEGFAALAPYFYLSPLAGYCVFLPIIQNFEATYPKPSPEKHGSEKTVEPEQCFAKQLDGIPIRKVKS